MTSISQNLCVLNHCILHLKLIQCYMTIISQYSWQKFKKIIEKPTLYIQALLFFSKIRGYFTWLCLSFYAIFLPWLSDDILCSFLPTSPIAPIWSHFFICFLNPFYPIWYLPLSCLFLCLLNHSHGFKALHLLFTKYTDIS